MGRKAALKLTPGQLQSKIDAYFDHCESSADVRQLKSGDVRVRKQWPTMVGLALWLDIHKDTLYKYLNGEYPTEWIDDKGLSDIEKHNIKRAYTDTLARARQQVEMSTITAAANGDIDGRIAQLLMHQWGYKSDPIDNTGTVTIQWQGVDKSDAERFSK